MLCLLPSSNDVARALEEPKARGQEELTELACSPEELTAVARAPDELTELVCVPGEPKTVACAPDELTELAGDQNEPTEVITAPNNKPEFARAPEELTQNAHAPEDQHFRTSVEQTTFVHAPEELMDITELKESLAEERSNYLSAQLKMSVMMCKTSRTRQKPSNT